MAIGGWKSLPQRGHWFAVIVFIGGCTAISTARFDRLYGTAAPRDRVVENLLPGTIDYWNQVKPVVEGRCVVCHGCFDAPCQLKMSSIEGIERGASPDKVYDESRLRAAPTTRLFEDAQSVMEWRTLGFHPVLNEHDDTPAANRDASVMYRMLELKQQNPLPSVNQLPASFDLSLNRKQQCTKDDEFDKYAAKHPLWGMPYALPGLAPEDQDVLMRWIEQGAPYTARPVLPEVFARQVDRWEEFLNGSTPNRQLTSRYIYEHLSYAHLYFPAVDELRFFNLVRSSTPPGQPVSIIATRRPNDHPGVDRVYYRLQEIVGTIVDKTHMPYALDDGRMKRWRQLFVDAEYAVTSLPPYADKQASNPFVTFAQLPLTSRYKFMLDEAQFTIMAFIKGPVCRGEVAVDVIDDNFWVFFTDPDNPDVQQVEAFLAQEIGSLGLPATTSDNYRPIHHWHQYRDKQTAFLAARDQFLADNFGGSNQLNLDLVWDGNGHNQNAALTIFRNFDDATVEKGLLGPPPKTAWVIDYSLLERIHYLLVARYDVFGNLGHQLDTRLYMDFLRMEGEGNFLMLLPEAARIRERDFWYRDVDDKVKAYVSSPVFEKQTEPGIEYRTDDPKQELYTMLRARLVDVLPKEHTMAAVQEAGLREQLVRLSQVAGTSANLLPEATILRIGTRSGHEYVTLLRNSAYANMTSVFEEGKNRLPEEDTVSVIPGFVGAYPNAFYSIDVSDVAEFVDAVGQLATEEDYARLLDAYGVRRTDPSFWRNSDLVHAAFRRESPITYGVLDYSRLENR